MADPIESTSRPRPFSMIRAFHVADLLTIANACCGMAAIFVAVPADVRRCPAVITSDPIPASDRVEALW